MKLIINADPEEMEYVLRMIMDARPMFDRGPPRPGWGWSFGDPGKRRFFIAEIKGGFSAKPAPVRSPALATASKEGGE